MGIEDLDKIAARHPGLRYRWRVTEEGSKWIADVQAGFEGICFPIWTATLPTREAALERAIGHAVAYWSYDTIGRASS